MNKKPVLDRNRFLLKNLFRGLLWLMIIVGGYFYAKKNLNFSFETLLGSFYDQAALIYFIFLSSEIIFGIIPPEFFMLWSLRNEALKYYMYNIASLALISYVAGVIGFFIGRYLDNTKFYRKMKKYIFGKFEKYLACYGGFLVVVASLTPVPFSGIAMLVGSVSYPLKRYLYFSLFRFARFIIYAMLIWKANELN